MDGRTHKALEDERPPELEGVRSPASKSARGGSGGGAAASRASRRKPPTPRSGAPPSPSHSAHSGAVSPSSSVRSGRSTKSAAPSAAADDDDAADADAAPARVGVGDRVSVSLRSGIMRGTVGYTGKAWFHCLRAAPIPPSYHTRAYMPCETKVGSLHGCLSNFDFTAPRAICSHTRNGYQTLVKHPLGGRILRRWVGGRASAFCRGMVGRCCSRRARREE